MTEARYIDLWSVRVSAEEFEEGTKYLYQIDKDLRNQNAKYKIQIENCAELRKNITKYEKQLEDISDDIQIFEELQHKLVYNLEGFNNQVESFNELEILIEKKRQKYFTLKELQKELNENVNSARKTLNYLHEHLEENKQALEEKKEKFAIYDKWIFILINRAKNLYAKINEMDEDLKATILESTDISDSVIRDLKKVVDYKRFHVDRKITFYNDTLATLKNTKERYALVSESIERGKGKINYLEKLISDEIFELGKIELEENSVRDLFEKTEIQWGKYMEIQETYNMKEKLRTTEEQLCIHWKEYCEIQQQENINRNKLFSQSLDLSMLESNIAFIVMKRDELEAQIALRLNGDTQ